jgi:predicted phage-related endonuclease
VIEYATEEWKRARLGWLTASRMADATARIKSGYGSSRANLMAALVCERLTDVPMETYFSKEMQWGIEHEAEAIAAYEWTFDATVTPIGFVRHPSIDYAGATPDGAVGEDGLIECKCPNSATHIETILSKKIDAKYCKQMQFQMACTGRKWVDFCTFDPRMPLELRLWTFRVMRDDEAIKEMEREARLFLAELDEKVAALRKIGRLEEAA